MDRGMVEHAQLFSSRARLFRCDNKMRVPAPRHLAARVPTLKGCLTLVREDANLRLLCLIVAKSSLRKHHTDFMVSSLTI